MFFTVYTKRKGYLACNFNCCIETEKVILLKVTGYYVQCKSSTIADMVPERDVATADH